MTIQFDGDIDFASATDYARSYRKLGIQVVPALMPKEAKNYKRPALTSWRELESTIVDDETFNQWFGPQGQYLYRSNLGIICGEASGGIWVLDLDIQKNTMAGSWLEILLEQHNGGRSLQTPTQRTGGGGLQILFRAPRGWIPPTCKTPIGIDVRGRGGFAVLPPSMHESGRCYEWLPGLSPFDVDILEAQPWVTSAIDQLLAQYGAGGSQSGSGGSVHTESPPATRSLSGAVVDGRETYATQMVWARVVDLYRGSPVKPTIPEQEFAHLFAQYERNTRSRIHEPGTPNHILLEREGRGVSLLRQKWEHALALWDTKVAEHAGQPKPRGELRPPATVDPETGEVLDTSEFDPERYEVLDTRQIAALSDPVWLVQDMIIEQSFGFIYGRPGSGKSFLALSMALAISTQVPIWFDKPLHRHGPVIYISSEGTGDIKFRLRAWQQHHGVNLDSSQFRLIRQTINFMAAGDTDKLLRTIAHAAQSIGDPVMVVVDTVSRVLPGAEENLQKDMTLFISACDRVRETFHCAVIGVHHTNKEGEEMRGSTALLGAGDSVFFIAREEAAMNGVVVAKKIKAAKDGWMMPFALTEIAMGDLKGTTSLVAHAPTEAAPEPSQSDPSDWPPRSTQWAILEAMQAAWDAKTPWSSKAQTRAEGRYAIARMHAQFGVSSEAADSMLNWWLDHGQVVWDVCDKKAKIKGLRVAKFSGGSPAEVGEETA